MCFWDWNRRNIITILQLLLVYVSVIWHSVSKSVHVSTSKPIAWLCKPLLFIDALTTNLTFTGGTFFYIEVSPFVLQPPVEPFTFTKASQTDACVLSPAFVYSKKKLKSVNVSGRMRVIIISITSECQTRGTCWGLGLRAWVERCSQGGNRFSGKGQACVRSAADHIQPPELLAFILGNNAEFYYLQERRRRNRSLMLWILHRLGPSVRLNWVTGVQRWGQHAALDKHIHAYVNSTVFSGVLEKQEHLERLWARSRSVWDNYFWSAGTFVFPSNQCDFSLHSSCKVDITALPRIWLPGVGACEGLSCIKHPQLLLDCC